MSSGGLSETANIWSPAAADAFFLGLLDPSDGSRVLDAGCGRGEPLARAADIYAGTDRPWRMTYRCSEAAASRGPVRCPLHRIAVDVADLTFRPARTASR